MNKQEAATALNTIYNTFHFNTTITPASAENHKSLFSDLSKFIDEETHMTEVVKDTKEQ